MKLPVFIATVLLLFLVGYGDAQEFNEEEIFNCYFIIICDLREATVLRRLIFKSGPEVVKKAFIWFKEITKVPRKCEDTPEFWNAYPDFTCNRTEEERKESFNEWIKRLGEYWADVCKKDPSGEECTKIEEGAMELNAIVAEYTAKGSCGTGIQSKGMEAAGDLSSKAPQGMKPPSFG